MSRKRTKATIEIPLAEDIARKLESLLARENLRIGTSEDPDTSRDDIIAAILSDMIDGELESLLNSFLVRKWHTEGWSEPFLDTGELEEIE